MEAKTKLDAAERHYKYLLEQQKWRTRVIVPPKPKGHFVEVVTRKWVTDEPEASASASASSSSSGVSSGSYTFDTSAGGSSGISGGSASFSGGSSSISGGSSSISAGGSTGISGGSSYVFDSSSSGANSGTTGDYSSFVSTLKNQYGETIPAAAKRAVDSTQSAFDFDSN